MSQQCPRYRPARLRVECLEDRTTPANLPTGFTELPVATGLSGATAMEFAPNGDLWVLEQTGAVKRFRVGSATPDLVADLSAVGLTSAGERGLLGIAFDPNFATNKFVYLYYTSTDAPGPHNRISRFTVNDANPNDYSLVDTTGNPAVLDETEILNLDPLSSATNHNGGAIHFGPDGKLYVAVGENANPGNSQSISNRLGKILRVNADGSIPADNPTSFPGIAGTTTGANRAIWAVGLRNPYTFTFQPGTGRMHINDVGQNTWEEVDVGGAGLNYGWPTTEGAFNPASFPNFTNPLYTYSHGSGTFQGFAITGGAFYNPATNQFPSDYAGDYFFADYVNGWIDVMNADGSGVRQFAAAAGGPVNLRVGGGGSLYYLARDGGGVYRVNYQTAQAPVVTQQPVGAAASAGGTVTFGAAAAGTATLSYQWQKFNGTTWVNLANGSGVSGATTATLTLTGVTAASAGQYRVAVSNAAGTATSDPATLTVNTPGLTIIDDGDAGFSAGSGWTSQPNSGGFPYFQGDHHYAFGPSGSGPTTWSATGLAAGTYRVSTTWVGYSNRATNAQYSVLDGAGNVIASRTINQQPDPNDFNANGANWEDVGTVTLNSAGNLTVRLLGSGDQYLIADAVRIELVPPPPPPPPPGTVAIIDDGDAGFSAGSGWTSQPNSGGFPYFQGDHHYAFGPSGSGPTTWSATGLAAGTYRVSATWVGYSNRAANAQYAVTNGSGTVLASRTVDQQLAPADLTANGTTWADVGVVTLTSAGSLTVSLAGTGDQYLIADAVRIELVPPPPPVTKMIIDDGDAGFVAGSGWTYQPDPSGFPYFEGDHHYKVGSPSGTATTWSATGLAAGTYRVSATWVGYSNRATNAQFAVLDGSGNPLVSTTVNQQLASNDFSDAGTTWEDVGTVTLSAAGTLTVRLAGTGNGALIADAVRFEKIA